VNGKVLKIATIHGSDLGGGAERSVLSHHKTLLKMGHQCKLYVGYKYTDTEGVYEIQRPRALPGLVRLTNALEKNFGWQNLYAPGFRRIVDEIEPDTDIVHINSLWGSSGYADIGALPAISKRFPMIITLRESWMLTGHCACPFDCQRWLSGCGKCPDLKRAPALLNDGTAFNWQRKKRVMQKTKAHITTVSDWLRSEAKKSPILAGKNISVIHNGVNIDAFKPIDKTIVRQTLDIPADRFVVLLAGQAVEGINEGIAQQGVQALNQITDERLLVLLVGWSAEQVAKTLTVPFMTLPFQKEPEEMAHCFQAADITMVTSEYESFGRIAAESQACGTPVISFATGGLPEVVKHGVGGLLVPMGDTDGLVEALNKMLSDSIELIAMGDRAASWAVEEFADEKISQEFLNLYQKVISDFQPS